MCERVRVRAPDKSDESVLKIKCSLDKIIKN